MLITLSDSNYNLNKNIIYKILKKSNIILEQQDLNEKINFISNDFLPNFIYPLNDLDDDFIKFSYNYLYYDNKNQILRFYSIRQTKTLEGVVIAKICINNIVCLLMYNNYNYESKVKILYDIERSIKDSTYLFNDYVYNAIFEKDFLYIYVTHLSGEKFIIKINKKFLGI